MEKQDATAGGPFVTYQIVRYLRYNVRIDAPSYEPWESDAPKIPLIAEVAGLTMGKGKGRVPSRTRVSSGAFPNGESDKGQKRYTDELKMQLKRALQREWDHYYGILEKTNQAESRKQKRV